MIAHSVQYRHIVSACWVGGWVSGQSVCLCNSSTTTVSGCMVSGHCTVESPEGERVHVKLKRSRQSACLCSFYIYIYFFCCFNI